MIRLDFGEMQQIVDAPGRDRGSRSAPRIDDDYIRHGLSDADGDDDSRSHRANPFGFLMELILED